MSVKPCLYVDLFKRHLLTQGGPNVGGKACLIGVLRWVPTPGCSITSLARLLEVPTLIPTTTLRLCDSHPLLTHDEAKAQGSEVSSQDTAEWQSLD